MVEMYVEKAQDLLHGHHLAFLEAVCLFGYFSQPRKSSVMDPDPLTYPATQSSLVGDLLLPWLPHRSQ
jgi:hypothetical protein